MTAIEIDRDRRPGAGAAPGPNERQPRAEGRRGDRGSRSAQFYSHLRHLPASSPHAGARDESGQRPGAKQIAIGEFSGAARWLTSGLSRTRRGEKIFSPTAVTDAKTGAGVDAKGRHPRSAGNELGGALDAISREVEQCADAAREGIMAEFAARIDFARKHTPRAHLQAALAAIRASRSAALAFVSRSAALELAGRKKVAIERLQPQRNDTPDRISPLPGKPDLTPRPR